MTKRRGHGFEREIERALSLGAYVGAREKAGFIETIEGVRRRIKALLAQDGGGPPAVLLLELFIAGCLEKTEEIEDSDGGFAQIVIDLFCDWTRARQVSKADPDETVQRLHSWAAKDDTGYCQGIETSAVAVLDRGGLRALERMSRAIADLSEKDAYAHRRSIEVLKAIQVKRGDVSAYRALCEAEEDLAPADCETLAEMSLRRRKPEEALAWVERGLELEAGPICSRRAAWRLPTLKREILRKLGRTADAFASAWEDYRRAPSVYTYETLLKLAPRGERQEWHRKALSAIGAADLSSRIELLVRTKEWERLASVVDSASREELMALSYYATEPAAKRLTRPHPLEAAKLEVAMALRVLEAKKSKYYDAALQNLDHARKVMAKHGLAQEWTMLAEEIRARHRRKSGFIGEFEKLAAGATTHGPSLAVRARRRWREVVRGERAAPGGTRPE